MEIRNDMSQRSLELMILLCTGKFEHIINLDFNMLISECESMTSKYILQPYHCCDGHWISHLVDVLSIMTSNLNFYNHYYLIQIVER